jgi:hypothetical protein
MQFHEVFSTANSQNARFQLLADELNDFSDAEVF